MSVERLLTLARSKGLRIATAESCTGGLVAAALTEVPGSSDVFDRGFVTYSNSAKAQMLGVAPTLIESHGAVSEQVAAAMAEGALTNSDANLAVSITGIAGPGGSDHKPEGMVCFGIAAKGPIGAVTVKTETQQFGALGRTRVRQSSVTHAIDMALSALHEPPIF